VIEVVCAVIVEDGKVMLCKRAAGMHLAGHWEFPGGKIEAGESAREALVREIREELGCEVEVGEGLDPVEHRYPDLAVRLRPFVCAVREGRPVPLEHEEIGWFGPAELPELGLAGADVEVAALLGD
jgi:8-oxo-dGTP diphosphatase